MRWFAAVCSVVIVSMCCCLMCSGCEGCVQAWSGTQVGAAVRLCGACTGFDDSFGAAEEHKDLESSGVYDAGLPGLSMEVRIGRCAPHPGQCERRGEVYAAERGVEEEQVQGGRCAGSAGPAERWPSRQARCKCDTCLAGVTRCTCSSIAAWAGPGKAVPRSRRTAGRGLALLRAYHWAFVGHEDNRGYP